MGNERLVLSEDTEIDRSDFFPFIFFLANFPPFHYPDAKTSRQKYPKILINNSVLADLS